MPDKEAMIAAVKTHCLAESSGDKETWIKLFADNVFIEDPVGSGNEYRGIEEVSNGFWPRAQAARPQVETLRDPLIGGNEAMALLRAEIGPEGARQRFEPIVAHFVFNDAGKVESLRAFFAV